MSRLGSGLVGRWLTFSNPARPDPPCPSLSEALKYIEEHGVLHPACSRCWKVLAFNLKPDAAEELISMFKAGLIPFSFALSPDRRTLIARAGSEEERDSIIGKLRETVGNRGKVEWRVACQALQIKAPGLFKSTKKIA